MQRSTSTGFRGWWDIWTEKVGSVLSLQRSGNRSPLIHNSLPTPYLSGFNTLRGITVDLLCRVTSLLRQMSHSSLVTSSVIKHRTLGHAFHSDIHQRLFFRTTESLASWLDYQVTFTCRKFYLDYNVLSEESEQRDL